MILALSDGREISTPLDHFPSLKGASAKHRNCWDFLGWGTGIDWPYLDLQLSVKGIVDGLREVVAPPGWRESRDAYLAAQGLPPIPSPEKIIAEYRSRR